MTDEKDPKFQQPAAGVYPMLESPLAQLVREARASGDTSAAELAIEGFAKGFRDAVISAIKNHPISTPDSIHVLDLKIEVERESDGRWIAEVADLPGVLVYGDTEKHAIDRAKALAFKVLQDRLEHGEMDALDAVQFVVRRKP